MSTADILFLGVGGFLLGAFAYTGWYTTRYEPEAKLGYGLMGLGIGVNVAINVWLDFQVESTNWYIVATFIGYGLVAAGLVAIIRERRRK